MRWFFVIGLALASAGCIVQTSTGPMECVAEPVSMAGGVVVTLRCSPIVSVARP